MNWGIIGCGNIANKFASDLKLVKGNSLYAVASRSGKKAKQFGDKYGASKTYDSYLDICQDENIDIIYLATPHNTHMQYGIMAMTNGKHLLCEKPLAVNTHQVNTLIQIAKTNRVFLMEALWSRFNPSICEVLDRLQNNEIGRIKYIHADFYFRKEFDSNHRLFNPCLAGGALLDIGIYPLFLSYLILGKPREVFSTSRLHTNGVDVQTSVILDYDNAQSLLSFGLEVQSNSMGSIRGEKGSFLLHDRWHEAQGYTEIIGTDTESHEKSTKGNGFTYEILECSQSIAAGKYQSDMWSHEDSLNLIEMCDTIRSQNRIKYPFE